MTSRLLAVRIRCGGRRGRCRLHLADVFVWATPNATGHFVETSQVQRDRGFPNLNDFVPKDLSGSIWFPTCPKHDRFNSDDGRSAQRGMNIQMACHLLAAPLEEFRRTGQTQDLPWTPTEETVVVVVPDKAEEERQRQDHYRMLARKESLRRRADQNASSGVRSETSTTL